MLSPLLIALDALNAETVRLDALMELPEGDKARLRESGVLDRTYVDTIKNVVSIVEAQAEKTFRSLVSDPDSAIKGRGNIFQRLDDLAHLFQSELSIDLRHAVGEKWGELQPAWATRHVYTHNELDEAGLIDDAELNLMLDPYRKTYPLPYKCSRERCSTTLAYWALHSSGARIAPGPERRGIGLVFPDLDWKQRFEEPIEWAMNGDGVITVETNPTVGSPWPLRWRFTCPRCNNQYVHTNKKMLRFFLQALYARRDQIRPGIVR